MTYSLVTFRSGAEIQLGIQPAGGAVHAPPELKQWPSMLGLLEDWARAADVLSGLSLAGAPVVDNAELLPPVCGAARCCARASTTRSPSGKWAASFRAGLGAVLLP